MPVSEAVKQSVRERAKYLCEYCHSLELLSANRFTIDHLVLYGNLVKTISAKGTVDEAVEQYQYDLAGNRTVGIDVSMHSDIKLNMSTTALTCCYKPSMH